MVAMRRNIRRTRAVYARALHDSTTMELSAFALTRPGRHVLARGLAASAACRRITVVQASVRQHVTRLRQLVF